MQYDDEKREKLDRLERKLYSRNAPNVIDTGRSDFKMPNDESKGNMEGAGEGWPNMKKNNFDELAQKASNMAQRKNSFVKKIFIFSVLFFIAASGVAAFVFWGGM